MPELDFPPQTAEKPERGKRKDKFKYLSKLKPALTTAKVLGIESVTCSGMEILSPFISVRTLLSSMTEFILSIQRVSTGPSNTIHFSSGLSSKKRENKVYGVEQISHKYQNLAVQSWECKYDKE